jgi:hypothetical protein
MPPVADDAQLHLTDADPIASAQAPKTIRAAIRPRRTSGRC